MLKIIKTILNVRPNIGDRVTTFIGTKVNQVTGTVRDVIDGNERGVGGYCRIDVVERGRIRTVKASINNCWFNYV